MTTTWWTEATFYEIYVRSFQDSNGDGIGDINGIVHRLPYLADLGVDALWLTPFYPSPQVDFGYDISDYRDVDPQFGTLRDFDRLVDEAHRLNLKIVTDLVLNHTSDQHPWFQESRHQRGSRKRDWYLWRDSAPGGGPPNNWSSAFGPTAWTLDQTTGQYYYHFFYPEQPDLNWRNPEVEAAMFDMVAFWMDRGVDGFRLDAIQTLYEADGLPDNPLKDEMRSGSKDERVQQWLYTTHQPETFAMLERLRAFVDGRDPNVVLIGEAADCATYEDLVPYYGCERPGVQLPFNFLFTLTERLSAQEFREHVRSVEAILEGERATTYVLSNHDLPRAIDRYAAGTRHRERIAKLLAMLLLTLRGSPFVYYGEEIGMVTTEPKRLEDVRDPVGRRYWPVHKGRDGERTPMQWDASRFAGFSAAEPWLPVPSSASRRNVSSQLAEPGSILNFYRALLRLRRGSQALLHGSYAVVGEDPNVFAYVRRAEDQTVLVGLNMSAERARVPGGELPLKRLLSNVHAGSEGGSMEPYEATIWEVVD
jgi:alpha-glucosidase